MKKILPVIVLYKIRLSDAASFRTLLQQHGVEEFVVYDNSPADFTQEDVEQNHPKAVYVRDVQNSGLPKAYNLAAEVAQQRGFSRLLLLDQDTEFPPEAWRLYHEHADFSGITAPRVVSIAGVAFSPYCPSLLHRSPKGAFSGFTSLRRMLVINSGMSVPVSLFLRVGGYDERVFLDFADFEFQKKLRGENDALCILPFAAVQDCSDDCCEKEKVMKRFKIYLRCAQHCRQTTWGEKVSLRFRVLRHTLSLSLRTRSFSFLLLYLKTPLSAS